MTKNLLNKTSDCFRSQNEMKTKTLEFGKKAKELRVVPEIMRRTKRAKIKKHSDAQTNTAKISVK